MTAVEKKKSRAGTVAVILFWTAVAVLAVLTVSVVPVYADIWDTAKAMLQDIYKNVLGISTIVAAVAACVALIIRMVSKNQRAVEEASSWLKRIVVCWLVLNSLGFFVTYLTPLIQGGSTIT